MSRLHRWVSIIALRQPGAVQGQPFGPDYEVFKIAGKVFAMTTTVRGVDVATVKSEPETGLALRQQHDFISAGYHMNKRHWVSISDEASVTEELVDELVVNSYLLVTDGLTMHQRAELRLHQADAQSAFLEVGRAVSIPRDPSDRDARTS